ncbi:glycosyltransferase [Alcanivorax sp. S6407]|uniref:glycosyltransferase family 2 protein n=1 Tax=Alcanivorax sp. S6407 TaxID=2926424 RepID=UPI001FF221EB|nr:glycosyltransferase [Alcanivorax sp. S6407]
MNKTRVDIIIPVFNDAEGISRCLASLDTQSKGGCQLGVIVVDNGSSPPVKIQKSYAFPVTMIHCDTPGSYAARNAGAAQSEADVLVFLDADCTPEKDWLINGLQAVLAEEGDWVIGGEVIYMLSNDPTATEAYQCIVGFGQEKNINIRGFTATANLFVRRELFLRVGDFDEALLSGGDREWCWRAERAGATVGFEKSAIVSTPPRRKLRSAIIQARRIAGGRYTLLSADRRQNLNVKRVLPERSTLQKLKIIWSGDEFGSVMRLKVLGVAVLLLTVRKLEVVRLKFGGGRERR